MLKQILDQILIYISSLLLSYSNSSYYWCFLSASPPQLWNSLSQPRVRILNSSLTVFRSDALDLTWISNDSDLVCHNG